MHSHVERLVAEALTLPSAARAELAHRLIESLHEGGDSQVETTGLAEALHRLDEIERGVVAPISADELFGRVRQRLTR